jgi:hypothetical protein
LWRAQKQEKASTERDVDKLIDAVYRNNVNSVRSLLRAGVNPAARDSLALQIARAIQVAAESNSF